MKVYKLNVLYPWWCTNFKSMYPVDHVETIVDGLKSIYGDLWEEIPYKNLEWLNENEVWIRGTYDVLPDYIKIVKGNAVYYFDLYSRSQIVAESADGIVYLGKYTIDNYMTKFQKKLSILIDKNPVVKFNRKYCDRFQKDSSNNWFIDFVAQKYLSSYIQPNSEKVRKLAYSTTESELYTNNFSSYVKPSSITLNCYADATKTWTISNFDTLLSTPSITGRYRYMVCKSSAKISTNNSKIQPIETTQTILLIPVWDNDVLHAINDINITSSQTSALSPLGDNFIGFWESDLPYSFIYGMEQDSSGAITMKYAENTCYGATTTGKVPFWEIPLNYYKKYKLIDFTQYSSGFAGKMTYMIQHLDKWNPETEPALYAPQNYQEVYNNGVGNITNDFSYFIYHWNGATSLENLKRYENNGIVPNDDPAFISMYAVFGFDDALNIAYDFGSNTNTKLASYDNTEVITSSVSIANQIAGSAAANYYSSNVNTGLTSVQNRKSEQTQAYVDASLNTAKETLNAAQATVNAKIGRKARTAAIQGAKAALNIAQIWTDTAMEQQRRNADLNSQYNNIYSSPSSIVGSPYIKGIIPNGNALFKTYAYELHDFDKKKIFGDILEYGRIYDTLDKLQAFDNNVYMNILDINPYTTFYRLLRLILENDNSMFNTQEDNEQFFVWLAEPHQMFNLWFPINCINYEADNYIDNIERTAYPTGKTHISTYITNIPSTLKAESSLLIAELQAANPSAPAAMWNDIEVVTTTYTTMSIRAKASSTAYYGTISKPCRCYNAKVGSKYIYDFNKVFANPLVDYIQYEDGTIIPKSEFDDIIEFNTKVSIIGFSQYFLHDCTSFNQEFTIPTNLQVISASFMSNCKAFEQDITIPNTVLRVGDSFMYNCDSMIGTVTVETTVPTFTPFDTRTLSTDNENAPCYTTGVTIAGSQASTFKTLFPDRDTTPFRKLV